MRVTVVQNNPQDDLEANLQQVDGLVRRAADAGTDLIQLPEYFAYMGNDAALHQASGAWFGDIDGRLAALARETGITLHAGSIMERRGADTYNTAVVYGPTGERIARYSKIHLFDVELPGGIVYKESAIVRRGEALATYRVKDWTVGCSICYDVRFPTLYRQLRAQGAELIVVPAAFAMATGKDHWEVLLRARAIETGCYVAAAAQVGTHAKGARACYGHSLVADPWGHVVARCSDKPGFVTATLDRAWMNQVRTQLPVHQHHVLD